MFLQVTDHGQFAAIDGGVTEAMEAFVSDDFQCDKIAPRARDNDFNVGDLHGCLPEKVTSGNATPKKATSLGC